VNRSLAMVLLALMIIGLLFSMYAFYQGRFAEALLIYPLLIVIYLFFRIGGKEKK
jgi:hypothetical protein